MIVERDGGIFIVLEGIDGSGKSTMGRVLKDEFEKLGHQVLLTREPGGTHFADKMRDAFVSSPSLDPDAQMLAIFSGRMDHVKNVIVPALQAGKVVICDRFMESTEVLQARHGGASLRLFAQLENEIQQYVNPDYGITFHIDWETSLERLAERVESNAMDRIYVKDKATFENIDSDYQVGTYLKPYPCCLVNANHSLKKVTKKVKSIARKIDP